MRLIMTLLVRNEEDVVKENIDFHLFQGVDHIVAMNNLSTDSTRDILSNYASQGVLTLIDQEDDDYAQSEWVTEMVSIAHYQFGADWIINNDADEFWFAENQNLKSFFEHLPNHINLVRGQRNDMVCVEGPNGQDDRQPFYRRMKYRTLYSPDTPLQRPGSKVAHRSLPGVRVMQGNHHVAGFPEKVFSAKELDILHYPLRSSKQFMQKINLGGKAYRNNKNLPKRIGHTWRHMYKELKKTGKISYLEENIYTFEQLDRMIDEGRVVLDSRLMAILDS